MFLSFKKFNARSLQIQHLIDIKFVVRSSQLKEAISSCFLISLTHTYTYVYLCKYFLYGSDKYVAFSSDYRPSILSTFVAWKLDMKLIASFLPTEKQLKSPLAWLSLIAVYFFSHFSPSRDFHLLTSSLCLIKTNILFVRAYSVSVCMCDYLYSHYYYSHLCALKQDVGISERKHKNQLQ